MDSMIQLALLGFLVVMSFQVFQSFAIIMLWGLILAVMIYPLHQRLAKRMGGKQGRSATVIVLIGCLSLGGPMTMLGLSFASQIQEVMAKYESGELTIKAPSEGVQDWPIFGEKVYAAWSGAAADLPEFVEQNAQQLQSTFSTILSLAGDAVGLVFMFLGAMIIAGIMMAWGKEGSDAMYRIAGRLAGPRKGPHLHSTSVATIRSVATGVIGVAVIQAGLLGLGFLAADIPAAGILTLIVVFIGIIQLPAIILTLPVIAYVWMAGDGSTIVNVALTVYLVVAGAVDGVLKPMLLGKGVSVPMPVVLIGALGGMAAGCLIGLFLGATLLAVAYQIFMDWVNEADGPALEKEESDTAEVSSS